MARLAKEAGIPKATLHGWTAGKEPSLVQLKKVATALRIPLHTLAFGEPDPFEDVGEEILKEIFSGDVRVTLHRIHRGKLEET